MRLPAAIALGLAAALLVPALALGGAAAWAGYLAGSVAWSAVPLGALGLLAAHRLTGGAWAGRIAPALPTAAASLPLAGLLFLPLLLALPELYPWAREGAAIEGPGKALWLSPAAFAGRSIGYWLLWSLLALWLLRGARPVSAAVTLIAYPVTASLAGIDWLMSLDRHFNSSIFGLLFLSSHAVAALAFCAAVTFAGRSAPPVGRVGGLLLATLLSWAYLAYTQYLVVWSADQPREAEWYLRRTDGGALVGAWIVLLLHGALPIAALTWRGIRTRPRRLAATAGLLLFAHAARQAWLVWPETAFAPLPSLAAFAGVILAGAGTILLLWPARWLRKKR